jgi:hypothetical protein
MVVEIFVYLAYNGNTIDDFGGTINERNKNPVV